MTTYSVKQIEELEQDLEAIELRVARAVGFTALYQRSQFFENDQHGKPNFKLVWRFCGEGLPDLYGGLRGFLS